MLDTHAVARSLTAADFTPAQADALTDALRLVVEQGEHVTSDQFKAGMAEMRAEMRTEIAEVRTEIANLDTRLSTQISTTETRLTGACSASPGSSSRRFACLVEGIQTQGGRAFPSNVVGYPGWAGGADPFPPGFPGNQEGRGGGVIRGNAGRSVDRAGAPGAGRAGPGGRAGVAGAG